MANSDWSEAASRAQLREGMRRHRGGSAPFILAIVLSGVMWWLYVFKAILKLGDAPAKTPEEARLYLIGAIVVPPFCFAWAVYQQRNVRQLIQNGVETTASVVEIQPPTRKDRSRLRIEYIVAGKKYERVVESPDWGDRRFSVGQTISVLYDPQKPSRFEVI